MRIHLLQSELAWERPAENLSRFQVLSEPLAGKSDLIVLPEMFNSGFTMNPASVAEPMDGPSMQWMRKLASSTTAVVTGSLVIERDGLYHNRLIWMRPDGDYRHYDKRHLFSLAGEEKHYQAGSRRTVFEWKGWKIFPLICYDLRFPVWCRRTVEFDFDLILYVANWPERRRTAWQRLLPARAIENQCYVAGLNRIGQDGNGIPHSGDSGIFDFTGEPLSAAEPFEPAVLAANLDLEKLHTFRREFPFGQDADGYYLK